MVSDALFYSLAEASPSDLDSSERYTGSSLLRHSPNPLALRPRQQHGEGQRHQQQRGDVAEEVAAVHRVGERLERHDRGVDRARNRGEPDQRDMRERIARGCDQEHAQRGIDPDDHHEILRGRGRARVPGPARGPDQRERPDEAEHQPEGDEQKLQQAVCGHGRRPLS